GPGGPRGLGGGSTRRESAFARSSKARNRCRGSSGVGPRLSMAADLYLTCYAAAMDRWLARLERRLGRYAPSNLTFWIVGLQGFTFALLWVKPDALQLLILDPSAVARGEVWRLVTFLFLPWGPAS